MFFIFTAPPNQLSKKGSGTTTQRHTCKDKNPQSAQPAKALADEGSIDAGVVTEAMRSLGVSPDKIDPVTV